MSEARLPRRRRSAVRTPALVDPLDIPEDAAGRVEVIAVRAPADVIDPGERPAPAAPPESSRAVDLLLREGGWPAVAGLCVLLVAILLLGMALTAR